MGVKRKQPDDSEAPKDVEGHHGSTIFVSNLPYEATSTDLQTLFSDYAPVRQAFVVLDKETKISKGVGYVSLAIKEDAERLVKELSGTAPQLLGRKLRVQWPGTKPETEKKSEAPAQSKPKKPRRDSVPRPTSAADPNAIRTIVISGLPAEIDPKPIWKKSRKFPGAEKVEYPVVGADGQAVPGTAHVVYGTHEQALAAVKGLHAHVFKGSLLSAVLKKRQDAAIKGSSAPNRASRLIVRNIPFHATENDLRALFLPYGPIHSIQLPMEAPSEEHPKPRLRGFAFVWMLTKSDAEKAIAGANGQVLGKRDGLEGRTVAVDWALSKDKWMKEIEEAQKHEEEDAEEDADVEAGGEEGEDEDDKSEASEDESGSDAFDHLPREDDMASEEVDDDDDEGDDDEDSASDSGAPVGRPVLPSTDVGTTLFVRNIPFEATEEELRTTFRAFGPLRYAKITMDPELGRSRGTGFVCFWNKEHADQAIADAELLNAETGASIMPEKRSKMNPFAVHSLLMPDPSSSLASRLVLQGRTLAVARAVPRDEAQKLKDEGLKKREKEDKRNLYLMREGVIFPNTPAAETIPPAELDRRMASFNTRRALLRTNPSLYISKTRLSVRQMPTFATDRTLKRLALYATREFEKEVAQGSRTGLTEDEKAVVVDKSKEAPKKKRGERPTAVIQSKVVRQNERVDPLTGKGKSKGYGFLEMRTHADALRVLRWANNNPAVNGLLTEWWNTELEDSIKKVEQELKAEKDKEKKDALADRLKRMKARAKPSDSGSTKEGKGKADKAGRGLILEFSIENVQVVRRRKDRLVERPEKGEKRKARPDGEASAGSAGPPFKRRRFDKEEKESHGRRGPSGPEASDSRGHKSGRKPAPSKPSASVQKTAGKNVGAVIGRKRKERKNKKA